MKIGFKSASVILCLLLVLLTVDAAQQPDRKPPQVSGLTTESIDTIQPTPGATAAGVKRSPAGIETIQRSVSEEDEQKQKAEQEWNERLSTAQDKLRELERRADNAELEITRLRNAQFSTSPKDTNTDADINARVAELAGQVRTLREQAKNAQAEVDALKREGEEKKYKRAEGSAKLSDGSPNVSYYQSRIAELRQELSAADTRIQVIQLRINDLSTRIRKNSGGDGGGGDVFALRRLKTSLQEEQKNLAEAQAKKAEAIGKIEELRRQAALAGVNPGDLR
jgi:chromosome segregation ATPase